MRVYPDYYPDFACIASRCRHSCCIGWEIDIDGETYASYQRTEGEIGARLAASVATEGTPHFILGAGERCPFLNREGLCELILALGEDSLCEICREHPRFYNCLTDRVEVGLGLCCEEAARLILTRVEPTVLVVEGESGEGDPWENELLLYRNTVLALLQDRARSFDARIESLLALSPSTLPPPEEMIRLCLSLEILTDEWRALLSRYQSVDSAAFSAHMSSRQYEYEQFAVYLAYRYLVTAFDEEDLLKKSAFIAWAYRFVFSLGAFLYGETGVFTPDDQIGLCRLFSSEIEYDEDNLDQILDFLAK